MLTNGNGVKHLPTRKLTKSERPLPGEEIVISGIAGKFPNAENVQVLSDKLYSKVSQHMWQS